jgi:hypothetical protein
MALSQPPSPADQSHLLDRRKRRMISSAALFRARSCAEAERSPCPRKAAGWRLPSIGPGANVVQVSLSASVIWSGMPFDENGPRPTAERRTGLLTPPGSCVMRVQTNGLIQRGLFRIPCGPISQYEPLVEGRRERAFWFCRISSRAPRRGRPGAGGGAGVTTRISPDQGHRLLDCVGIVYFQSALSEKRDVLS